MRTNTLMGDPGDHGRERAGEGGSSDGGGNGSKVPPGPGFRVYIDMSWEHTSVTPNDESKSNVTTPFIYIYIYIYVYMSV